MSIRVHIWGSRGSLPAPLDAAAVERKVRTALELARGHDLSTAEALETFIRHDLPFSVRGSFGGNSSCVQLDNGGDEFVLCDSGSGLRVFGNSILARDGPGTPHTYNILMSHVHWDHLMGFPFFTPSYIPGNTIRIHGAHPNLRAAFERQHGPPSFPVPFSLLGANIEFVQLEPGKPYTIGGFNVIATKQQHGGDSYGYRFQYGESTVVYSTDSEHKFERAEDRTPFLDMFHEADVVIFDAMYSLGETMSVKEDWGHSSNVVGVELAQAAGAKHLVLFHHEPAYDDATIERVLEETRRYEEIVRKGPPLQVSSAYDGLEIVV